MTDVPDIRTLNTLAGQLPADLEILDRVGEAAVLHAHEVLRLLPDKRLVCGALWNNRSVVAKIFAGKRGQRDRELEERGVRRLGEAGILTPALLHSGRLAGMDADVLIFERIEPARNLKEAWRRAEDSKGREELLLKSVSLLARHHESGVRQADLHLRNFLVSSGDIYTIDTSGVESYSNQVPMQESIENLAMLLSQMYIDDPHMHEELYRKYVHLRNRGVNDAELKRLKRTIARWRDRLKQNLFDKIFRECTAYVYRQDSRGRIICRRDRATPDMENFLENIDTNIESDENRLKDGRSSTVYTQEIDGHLLVVKRYNIKGLWHKLSRALRPTRAAWSWKNAHLLLFHGIPTPTPVALVEKGSGIHRGASFFIYDYVEGLNARRHFRKFPEGSPERQRAIEELVQLLDKLGSADISHGDMKGANYIITPDGPMIVDLDALVEHKSGWRASKTRRAELQRFLDNWLVDPDLHEKFSERLAAELES